MTTQVSYVTLPSNKQALQKSSSMADKLNKIGLKMISNVRDTNEKEKVIKIPIAQKNYNLEIWKLE